MPTGVPGAPAYPDYRNVPQGRPVNPLTGQKMDLLLPQGPFPAQPVPQPTPETFRPPFMENPGITNVSGQAANARPEASPGHVTMASGAAPEAMRVPSPVSALDPAYSMHPVVRALGRTPGQTMGNLYNSPFMQMPPSMNRGAMRTHLLTALGLPGMAASRTETQGNVPGIM